MKTIDTKQNGIRYVGEIFDGPEELIKTVESRIQVFGDKNSLSYHDESNWTGYRDGSQFKADFLASKATQAIVKDVEARLSKVRTQDRKRVQFYNDVEGFAPIVPLALMGVPESMRSSRMVQSKSKVVTVLIDCTASAYVKADDIARSATELVGTVSGLEKQGYRVNLIAGFVSNSQRETSFVGVKIKDASQPLNLSRILFPFTTAAFMRRGGFAWYETKEGIHHDWGYGVPIIRYSSRKQVLADAICKGTVYLGVSDMIQGGVDVEQALKEAVA